MTGYRKRITIGDPPIRAPGFSNWQDTPSTATPVGAADFDGWEQAIYDLKTQVFNVQDYGAKGDGVTDDTQAVRDAITDIPGSQNSGTPGHKGGVLYFPASAGDYIISGDPALTLDNKKNVLVLGAGRVQENRGRIDYTGTGTFLTASGGHGITLEGLYILVSNAAHSGTLIDFSTRAGALSNSFYCLVRDCFFDVSAAGLANTIISYHKAQEARVYRCSFNKGGRQIKGRNSAGVNDFSNAIRIVDCHFAGATTAPISNPNSAWLVHNCTFEPLNSGSAGAILCDNGIGLSTHGSLTVQGCWTGDAGSSGVWYSIEGTGAALFEGGLIDSGASGIKLTNALGALAVIGVTFDGVVTAIDANGKVVNVFEAGNAYIGVTNKVIGDNVIGANSLLLSTDTNGWQWAHDIDIFHNPVAQTNWTNNVVDATCIHNGHRDSTGAQNASIEFDATLEKGVYTFELLHKRGPDRGIYTLAVDPGITGTYANIGTIDGYTAAVTPNSLNGIASSTIIPRTGRVRLRLTMATKNAANTTANYYGSIQHIQIRRTS